MAIIGGTGEHKVRGMFSWLNTYFLVLHVKVGS